MRCARAIPDWVIWDDVGDGEFVGLGLGHGSPGQGGVDDALVAPRDPLPLLDESLDSGDAVCGVHPDADDFPCWRLDVEQHLLIVRARAPLPVVIVLLALLVLLLDLVLSHVLSAVLLLSLLHI